MFFTNVFHLSLFSSSLALFSSNQGILFNESERGCISGSLVSGEKAKLVLAVN